MKLYEIYFSPTGRTERVAEILGSEFEGTREKISLLSAKADYTKYQITREDICIVAVPSFGGRVPEIAVERLLKIKGNGAAAVLAAAYGNRAFDDTLAELKTILEQAGFICTAAVAAVTEHSIMRQFGAGRPDQQDEKELKEFAKRIKQQILKEEQREDLKIPGNFPYREFHKLPFCPKPDKQCSKCGICASECPVGAISSENPGEVNEALCMGCMRCTWVCPVKARGINKIVLLAAAQKMKKACGGHKNNELFL